jgi:hypothetical protein
VLDMDKYSKEDNKIAIRVSLKAEISTVVNS